MYYETTESLIATARKAIEDFGYGEGGVAVGASVRLLCRRCEELVSSNFAREKDLSAYIGRLEKALCDENAKCAAIAQAFADSHVGVGGEIASQIASSIRGMKS